MRKRANIPTHTDEMHFSTESFYDTDPAPVCLPNREILSLHRHDCFELGICLSGQGVFAVENEMEPIAAGDAVLIPSRQRHYSRSLGSQPCMFRFLYLRAEDCFRACGLLGAFSHHIRTWEQLELPTVFHSNHHPSAVHEIEALLAWGTEARNDSLRLTALGARFGALMLELQSSYQSERDFVLRADGAIERAMEYMTLHYAEKISIRELASLCCLSESQFRRRFRDTYDQSPHVYLTAIRCQLARRLLQCTDFTVTRIAAEVGFGNPSELYRAYTKQYGNAPAADRTAIKDPC